MADPHKLYGCHDQIPAHKSALFQHLVQRRREDLLMKLGAAPDHRGRRRKAGDHVVKTLGRKGRS